MRFDNYYLGEYRRVLDNIKVNEEKFVNFAENIEKNIEIARSEEIKKVVVSAAIIAVVGIGMALRRRK